MPSLSPNIADAALVPPAAVRRSRVVAGLLLAYVGLLVAAWISADGWLQGLAAFVLVSLLLAAGLRRGSVVAWLIWIGSGIAFASLVARGDGRAALDMLPALVDATLCWLFARTLMRGSTPLIAQVIVIMEGEARLALPRVAAYARQLTLAWALLFGAQALAVAVVLAAIVPDGLLAMLGLRSPLNLAPGWRWYLHVGSYAVVIVFMLGEYAFRCWHLRTIPHQPLSVFLGRLARRWPMIARQLVDPPSRGHA